MNWQQVRAKIERGESSDKIGGLDPAAVPLGTDGEAAAIPKPVSVVGNLSAQRRGRPQNPMPHRLGPKN